jgi:hypothetical protein
MTTTLMMTLRSIALPLVAVTAPACLEPRVDDAPGASVHLLPGGAAVPLVTDNAELINQITLNDGIDDRALDANGVLARGTGMSAGQTVRFWRLGAATRAPSPIYEFYDEEGMQPHPALVDALPGDPGYSPLHAINRVVLRSAYNSQLITTTEALADAIDLGLVSEPEPEGIFLDTPIVLPDTQLELGGGMTALPKLIYARGHQVGVFRFGGERGPQPGSQLLPSLQVSFLRAARGAGYDTSRPIFQATIPTMVADQRVTYTPLSEVIEVDLAEGVDPAAITDDSQLFVRADNGRIMATTELVTRFEITGSLQLLQLQFTEGEL